MLSDSTGKTALRIGHGETCCYVQHAILIRRKNMTLSQDDLQQIIDAVNENKKATDFDVNPEIINQFEKTGFYHAWSKAFGSLGLTGVIAIPNTTFNEWLFWFQEWSKVFVEKYNDFTALVDKTFKEIDDSINNLNNEVVDLHAKDAALEKGFNEKINEIMGTGFTISPNVVASLDELKSKFPNGADGVYIAADNGHKYVWVDGAWKDAGVYQSVGITDEQKDSIGDYLEKRTSLIGDFNAVSQGRSTITTVSNTAGTRQTKATSQDSAIKYTGLGWNISNAYPDVKSDNGLFFKGDFSTTYDIRELGIGIAFYDESGALLKSYITTTTALPAGKKITVYAPVPCPDITGAKYVNVTAVSTDSMPIGAVLTASNYTLVKKENYPVTQENILNDYNVKPQANMTLSYRVDDAGNRWTVATGSTNTPLTYNGINANVLTEVNYYKKIGYKYLNFVGNVTSNIDQKIEVHLAGWDINGKAIFDENLISMYVKANDVIPIDVISDLTKNDMTQCASILFSIVTPNTVNSSFKLQIVNYSLKPLLRPISLFKTVTLTTSQGNPYYSVDKMNNLIVTNPTTDTTKAWHGYYLDIRSIIKYLFSKKIPYFRWQMEVTATQDSTYLIQTNYQNATDHKLSPIKTVDFIAGQAQIIDINIPVSDPTNFPDTIQLVFTTPKNSVLNNAVSINLSTVNIYYNAVSSDNSGSGSSTSSGNHLPTVKLTGDISTMSKDNKVPLKLEFTADGITKSMYAKVKWQGDSSLAWPKKNYRIELYNDATLTDSNKVRFFADFPKNDKFNLKANYTDASHTRNIVSADLFSQITALRPDVNPVTAAADNFSQIKGKPINVYINGTYNGLYSLNTYDNNTLFNFDKTNPNHFAVEASKASDATLFKSDTALLDGTDFELEYPDDVTDDIKTKLNRLLAFANSSTDADFLAHESEYININSFIDYILFNALIMNDDGLGKNAIYQTFDGNIWYALPYDLDSTWRMYWTGASLIDINTNFLMPNQNRNKLFTRVITANKTALKNRWTYLRSNVLRADHVIKAFEDYYNAVGQENYKMDQTLWPNIPSISITDFNQIRGDIYNRLLISDKQVAAL